MIVTFCNSEGRAVAYLDENGESIYLYDGTPVAWLSDNSIYSYSGRYLGWFQNGWVWDLSGHCVFFTDNASVGVLVVQQDRLGLLEELVEHALHEVQEKQNLHGRLEVPHGQI